MNITVGSPHVLGIEISKQRTRVVEMNYRAKKPQIYELFEFKTPKDMIRGGVIVEAEEFSACLKEECKRRDVACNKVIFSITSTRIMEKEAVVPALKPNRMNEMLRLNATEYFPVDVSQYVLSYEIIEKIGKSGSGQKCRLLIKAIPREILESYHMLAEKCGLQLVQIDHAMNGIAQTISMMEKPVKEQADMLRMYLVADDVSARVLMIKNKRVVLQRTLIQNLKSPVTLAQGTIRVLDYYLERSEGMAEAEQLEVVLMGSASESPELKSELEERLGQEVKLFEMIDKKLVFDQKQWPVAAVCDYAANVGACINPLSLKLARKKTDISTESQINIGELFLNDKIQETIAVAFLWCGLVFGMMATYYLLNGLQGNSAYQDAVVSQQLQIAQLQKNKLAKDSYDQSYSEYKNMLEVSNNLRTANDSVLLFLEELEDVLPSDAAVKTISFTETGASVSVEVTSWESVAFTIMQFREMETAELLEESLPTSYQDTGAEVSGGTQSGDAFSNLGSMDAETKDYSGYMDEQLRSECKKRSRQYPELVGSMMAQNGVAMTQAEMDATIDTLSREDLIRALQQSDLYIAAMNAEDSEGSQTTPDHLYTVTAAFEYKFEVAPILQNIGNAGMSSLINDALANAGSATEETTEETAEEVTP